MIYIIRSDLLLTADDRGSVGSNVYLDVLSIRMTQQGI